MIVLILGPQGSGKGTQARLLAQTFGFYYFEAGELLREMAKTDKKIEEIVNKKGKLIPDEEMFNLVCSKLVKYVDSTSNILLDGFPRTIKQYNLIKNWLKEKGQKIDLVLFLNISEEETIIRLSARRVCTVCSRNYNLITEPPPTDVICECGGKLILREDDQPLAIKERLSIFKNLTEPLLRVFSTEGIIKIIDGERSVEEIQKDLVKIVKEIYG